MALKSNETPTPMHPSEVSLGKGPLNLRIYSTRRETTPRCLKNLYSNASQYFHHHLVWAIMTLQMISLLTDNFEMGSMITRTSNEIESVKDIAMHLSLRKKVNGYKRSAQAQLKAGLLLKFDLQAAYKYFFDAANQGIAERQYLYGEQKYADAMINYGEILNEGKFRVIQDYELGENGKGG
ncbi:27665_t:CDS:2 [Dentiscutata erythropus]|uniref:27665_t:CDS:1 n=1 Tax=Dentiscutata erythropus TaxID=1348616 RepID=A0A9N9GPF9_9GLOM|nr:27665_t:CDS:2 [Dentiscutata erythropus]